MSKQRQQKPAVVSAPVERPVAPVAVEPKPSAHQPPHKPEGAGLDPFAREPAPRATWEDFKAAAELGLCVCARLSVGSGPALRAGLVLDSQERVYPLRVVLEAGESHLRALATDPDIEARIVEAG